MPDTERISIMSILKNYKLKNYNYRIIIYALVLNILGVLLISSATKGNPAYVNKQIMGIIISFVILIVLSFIPYQRITKLAIPIYIGSILSLLAVWKLGVAKFGAKRWIVLPVIGRIQPSEFVKIALVICMAWILAKNIHLVNKLSFLLVFAAFVGVPYLLILSQPDLSTTLVSVVSALVMIFVAGLNYKWICGAIAAITPFAIFFIELLKRDLIPIIRDYQRNRILAWVDRENYVDANFQQNGSIMAIASGQLFGKGLNNNSIASVKTGNYLVEEQTDFIFAVIGEELGFAGCMFLVFMISLIVYELINIASKSKDLEGKLICVGMAAIIGFQTFTNIAVATGLFPNTGIPLPFISYGVSSLMSLYVCLGIVLNVGLQRDNKVDSIKNL